MRDLRQECPLSPMLFNIMIADVNKVMGRGGEVGESKIRRKENIHFGLC